MPYPLPEWMPAWLDAHPLPEVGHAMIVHAWENDPGRAVRATHFSGTAIIPSWKTGFMVAVESRTVELPVAFGLEHDEDVIDYLAQPDLRLWIAYPDPERRPSGYFTTPDFLVARRDHAEILECKPEEWLVERAARDPGLFVRDPESGTWRCPPGEAAVSEHGLIYRLVSSAQIDRLHIRNLEFLAAAFRAAPIAPAVAAQIVARVDAKPGISMGDLIRDGVDPDALHGAIVTRTVYVDLHRDVLAEPDRVPVYPNETIAAALAHRHTPSWAIGGIRPALATVAGGDRIRWDGIAYEIVNAGRTTIRLRTADQVGQSVARDESVARNEFEGLVRTGQIVPDGTPPKPEEVGRLLAERRYAMARPGHLSIATARLDVLAGIHRPGQPAKEPHDRTKRRWKAAQMQGLERTGDPVVGLLPATRPGNRLAKVDSRCRPIADAVIDELYLTPTRGNRRAVTGEVRRECGLLKIKPPSDKTIREWITIRERDPRAQLARLGFKGAYAVSPWAIVDPEATPINGDFPWALAHIDATELDLEFVCQYSGVNLGRGWLCRMVDSYLGTERARVLAFSPPGGAQTLELLRHCGERYRQLPQALGLDWGSENRNRDVVTFAQRQKIELRYRPKSRGRHGGPVERPFGSLNTQLLYSLAGNTQASKSARQGTPATNPKTHAVWTLPEFDALLDRYNALVDGQPRASDGRIPSEIAAADEAMLGRRPALNVTIDAQFRLLTMPSVTRATWHIHPERGVALENLDYWHPIFRHVARTGTRLDVRTDTNDISRAAAYVPGPFDRTLLEALEREGRAHGILPFYPLPELTDDPLTQRLPGVWVELRNRTLARIRVVSVAELTALSHEIRARLTGQRRGRDAYAVAVAGLIAEARETEKSLAARRQAVNKQAVALPDGRATVPTSAPQPGPVDGSNGSAPAPPTRRGLAADEPAFGEDVWATYLSANGDH
jgi:putative transposase